MDLSYLGPPFSLIDSDDLGELSDFGPPFRLSSLDKLLLSMFDGLPVDPGARWELRCHPDVYQAMLQASAEDLSHAGLDIKPPARPRYGRSAIVVDSERLTPGQWELRPEGAALDTAPVKAGRIGGTA